VWPTDLDKLRRRCAAIDRLVDRQAAAHRQAAAERLAHPDDVAALHAFEAAEERYCLMKLSQQKAHRALQRAEHRHAVASHLLHWLGTGRSVR